MKDRLEKIKGRLGPLWWYSGLMLIFSQLGNIINFYIGSVLAIDYVNPASLGAILPLTQLALFITLPQAILLRTYSKYINVFHTLEANGKIKRMLRDLSLVCIGLSILTLAVLWKSQNFISLRLAFSDPHVIWLVGAISIISCWAPIVAGASLGVMQFKRIILKNVVGPVTRLVVILLTLKKWQLTGYLLAHFCNLLAGTVFLAFALGKYVSKRLKSVSYKEHHREMLLYMLPMAVVTTMLALQGLVEPWVIRQRMIDSSAGYFVISRFGIIPMVLVQAIAPFVFPIVSRRHERGEPTSPVLMQALGAMLLIGMVASAALGLFGKEILSLRSSWANYIDYAPLLFQVAMISVLTVLVNTHMAHENACRRFGYLWYFSFFVIAEVLVLYGLNVWDRFKPLVSLETHAWVERNMATDFNFTVWFMLLTRLGVTACIGMQVWALWRRERRA